MIATPIMSGHKIRLTGLLAFLKNAVSCPRSVSTKLNENFAGDERSSAAYGRRTHDGQLKTGKGPLTIIFK